MEECFVVAVIVAVVVVGANIEDLKCNTFLEGGGEGRGGGKSMINNHVKNQLMKNAPELNCFLKARFRSFI